MVGEVPLAPRVEDKEEAREKSRVPPLWRNNSEGSLARARSAHGSSVTPSTGTASVTHSFAKGQPIHSSKFTHSRPRILPSKERIRRRRHIAVARPLLVFESGEIAPCAPRRP